MALYHSPRIVTDGMVLCLDAANPKTSLGTNDRITDLSIKQFTGFGTTVTTAIDATAGAVIDHNNSTQINCTFSPNINHETWSFNIWTRSTGLTSSNYRHIITIVDTNSPHGYFYILDTRETTNSYPLGFQKDYNINSWLTYNFMSAATWAEEKWWCIGVSHNNTVFKHYLNGNLVNTQTQTRDVAGYGDLIYFRLNNGNQNTVFTGPVQFYDRVLTDEEFKENFNALRGRFGL